MIKNVVFDMGNVLLTFRPLEYLRKSYSNNTVIDKLYNEIFKSREWLDLDKGVITDEEAISIVTSRIPDLKTEVEEFFEQRIRMFDQITGTVDILEKVKKSGFRIYYLTNFHYTSFYKVHDKFEFFEHFDGGVLSAAEKLLKPEAEIFKVLLSKFSLIPSETVFLDDTEENITAARELGINAIHFNNPAQAALELAKLGVQL